MPMNEPKLIDFPVEEHEPAALEVMLAGCATDAERKAVRADGLNHLARHTFPHFPEGFRGRL